VKREKIKIKVELKFPFIMTHKILQENYPFVIISQP